MRKRIAVYCSSRENLGEEVTSQALDVAGAIGRLGCDIIYGGVNAGLMHMVASAAHDAGAFVTGVIPEIFRHRADPLCDKIIFTSDLNVRKGTMISNSDIFIVLPGGLGTIDEWISTISDIMVREKTDPNADRPILVLNINGMYDGIVSQLTETATSVFARGKRVDRSFIFTDSRQLIAHLNHIVG